MIQTTQRITKGRLAKILLSITGAMPATILVETEVKMNKTNNPYFGEVTKLMEANVFINFNYQNSVNRARVKEGKAADFVAQPRKWGQKVPNTPLILHNGAYYLEARFLGSNRTKTAVFHKGRLLDPAKISSFVAVKSESKTQDLEKEVVMRDFKLENIKEITLNGIHYIVR